MTSPATPTNGLDIDALAGLLVKASDDRNTTVVVRCDEARTLLAAYRGAEALRTRVAVLTDTLAQTEAVAREHYEAWITEGCDSKEAIRFVLEIADVCCATLNPA